MNKTELNEIRQMIKRINQNISSDINIMEVCGTHTLKIAKYGLKKLLSPKIRLISGPGCPVCVTQTGYIDAAIALLDQQDVMLVTFGDMMRVKGDKHSLQDLKYQGKSIKIMYSPEEVIELSHSYPDKRIVVLAVGFETTAPLFALIIDEAKNQNINNLFFLTSLKRMEPVISYILNLNEKINVHGMLCPGHVASITGIKPFCQISDRYLIPSVICGFEAQDIVKSIYVLTEQIKGNRPLKTENLYKRCVSAHGNKQALEIMNKVFCIMDGIWRGIGSIKDSAFEINEEYKKYDAKRIFELDIKSMSKNVCNCGDILLGLKKPVDCKFFGGRCNPENPLGPCMVSTEGTCCSYYKYGRFE